MNLNENPAEGIRISCVMALAADGDAKTHWSCGYRTLRSIARNLWPVSVERIWPHRMVPLTLSPRAAPGPVDLTAEYLETNPD